MLQTSVRRRVCPLYARPHCFFDAARTYPVSGIYSPAQRDLYTAVLNAQKGLIKMCSEAAGVSLTDLHRKSAEILTAELKQISTGFQLTQSVVERELYPHFVGHHIGIGLWIVRGRALVNIDAL